MRFRLGLEGCVWRCYVLMVADGRLTGRLLSEDFGIRKVPLGL